MKKLLILLTIGLLFTGGLAAAYKIKGAGVLQDIVNKGNSLIFSLANKLGERQNIVAQRIEVQKEVIDEFNLKRLPQSGGLKDVNSTDKYVEEQSAADAGVTLSEGQVSYYQAFVTPGDSAVQTLASGKQHQAIYQEAISWVWVPDIILHNQEERWLTPNFFLTKTPGMPTNPVSGKIASDCESQAYTLVSALRASGVSAEEVRVVTGKVNFGNTTGGHAWVELYDKNSQSWFQLEATSGNYYDTETNKLILSSGLPFEYFKTYQYPSVQIWTYFNDKYFWDNNRHQGTAPDSWLTQETQTKKAPEREIRYEPPENLRRLRPERTIVISEATNSSEITPQPWIPRRRPERNLNIIQESQPTIEPTEESRPTETATETIVNESYSNVASESGNSENFNDRLLRFFRRGLRR